MKKKILVIAPYGMTLRQVVLNKELWSYLCDKYEVHVKTSVNIQKHDEIGIHEIIIPQRNIINSVL